MATTMGIPASGISSPWTNWYKYMGGQEQFPTAIATGGWAAPLGQAPPTMAPGGPPAIVGPGGTQPPSIPVSAPTVAPFNRPILGAGGGQPANVQAQATIGSPSINQGQPIPPGTRLPPTTPSPTGPEQPFNLPQPNQAKILEEMVKAAGGVRRPTVPGVATLPTTAAGGLSDLLQNLQPAAPTPLAQAGLGAVTTPAAQVQERVTTGVGGTTELAAGAGAGTYTPPVPVDDAGKPKYIDYAAYHKWAATQPGWKPMNVAINKILKDYWTTNILPLKEGEKPPPGPERPPMSKDDEKKWKTIFETVVSAFDPTAATRLFKIWSDPKFKPNAAQIRFKTLFDTLLGQFAAGTSTTPPSRADVSAAFSKYLDGEVANRGVTGYFSDATQKAFVESMTNAMMDAIDSYVPTEPEPEGETDAERRLRRWNELYTLYQAKDKAGLQRLIITDPEYDELYKQILEAFGPLEPTEPVTPTDLTPEQIADIVKQIQDALAKNDMATITGLLLRYPQIKDNWDIIKELLFPTTKTTTGGYVPPANWWEQGWSGGQSPYTSGYGTYAGLI